MSIESWKAEFYPVEADKCPKEDAVAHCIKKWEGLYADNLKKHFLRVVNSDLYDRLRDEVFYVDSNSCALCQQYYNCTDCPLYRVRKGVSCAARSSKEVRSPFTTWEQLNRADHMLRWLKKIE